MKISCSFCGRDVEKSVGHINRAESEGRLMFCDRICFGLNRRKNKTTEQKKLEKSEYDKRYLAKNHDKIKAQNQIYNQTTSGRAMQKRNREKFKESHKKYIKTPKYRAWKKVYDRKFQAKKQYGEFWESFLLLRDIEYLIPNREVMQQNNLNNKSQKRKRNYEKFKREELERSTLGNPK